MQNFDTVKRIFIVGGGPAGMMAAIRASQLNADVTLIERNPSLGRKLLLTGKGRCNLTNACTLEQFRKRFSRNSEFLRDAFKVFFNNDLLMFFKERGLNLKTERQLRVFPATDKSASVLDVLKKELEVNKVKILYNRRLKDVLIADGRISAIEFYGGSILSCQYLILATGGLSYAFTGSSGEGLLIAKKLGHRVVKTSPGLVPLKTKERYPQMLEGITLKNVRLKFMAGQKKILSEIGELLFTDFGVSGPLVLSLSGRVIDLFAASKKVILEIDLKPALTAEKLSARFLRDFNLSAKKNIKNILKGLLPARMVDVFMKLAGIYHLKAVNQLTHSERQRLVNLFKAMPLEIAGPLPLEEAMVTRGGVSLNDIDPRTMQSRLIKGLYFAGEMIDVDADTGGFNLQAAFSTGYLAGQSAACPNDIQSGAACPNDIQSGAACQIFSK